MSTVLEALMISLPLMSEIFDLDVQICLCDREKTIGVWYGKTFRLDIRIGDILDEKMPGADMILLAMESKKGNKGYLPEFVYGVPVRGVVTPVFENDKVVGAVTVAISIAQQKDIEEASSNLNFNLTNTQSNVDDIAKGSNDLVTRLGHIQSLSENVESLIGLTNKIVAQIQSSSKKSNMLALNASIEAARAGIYGNGFAVVAKEMGNLANVSAESTKEIGGQLQGMFLAIAEITSEVHALNELATNLAASVEEINASLDSIVTESGKMESLTKVY